ncbi:MAG: hypothetical protein HQK59_09585 [Deltaproteobacteria bacterium]|nr:hypothetical protein [Deltaproteobacteria bacterium]
MYKYAVVKNPVPPTLNSVEETINLDYTVDVLKKLCKRYIENMLIEAGYPRSEMTSVNQMSKIDLVRLLAKVFSDKALFDRLWSHLPDNVRKVLEVAVWEGGAHEIRVLEKKFGIKIVDYQKRGRIIVDAHLNVDYLLLKYDKSYNGYSYYGEPSYYLYLPPGIKKIFKEFLPLPPGYNITPVKDIPKTNFIFTDQNHILTQIKLFWRYIRQGNIKFSKAADRPLAGSIKQMALYCDVQEFYDHKGLEYLRTRLLLNFLIVTSGDNFINDASAFLKQLVGDFLNSKNVEEYRLGDLLFHLGGVNLDYSMSREKKIRSSISKILKALPVAEWVSIDNVITFALYRELFLDVVSRTGTHPYYMARYKAGDYHGHDRTFVTEITYKETVIVPFLKAVMFLFAGLGLLDVSYDLPRNELFQSKALGYLSVFDGLKYIRLTSLGSYVMGLTKKWEEVTEEEEEARIILDETRLLISIEGKDRLKEMMLTKIAHKITDHFYKMDYTSFLKGCSSRQDVLNRVALFEEEISAEPPPAWQRFLDEIINRINPLTAKKSMAVFQLKPDKELLSLMVTDEILKQYIIKAENYLVVIESNNLNKVNKRLEEFGYFIDHA